RKWPYRRGVLRRRRGRPHPAGPHPALRPRLSSVRGPIMSKPNALAHPVRVQALADSELAARPAAGDATALEAIMRRHNRRLFRTARAVVEDDGEAEDVLQEAYLRAPRALGKFRAESRLSTWLVRITANEAL